MQKHTQQLTVTASLQAGVNEQHRQTVLFFFFFQKTDLQLSSKNVYNFTVFKNREKKVRV